MYFDSLIASNAIKVRRINVSITRHYTPLQSIVRVKADK